MQQILDYIDANFAQIRNVKDVSDKFFISSATLNRWFKKYLKISPGKYLETIKLAHAKKVLQNGGSVTEACFSSGFTDCSHFIVLFKKRFNVTPNKFKNNS
jgi:AraC-like DNA-binding protein